MTRRDVHFSCQKLMRRPSGLAYQALAATPGYLGLILDRAFFFDDAFRASAVRAAHCFRSPSSVELFE